LSDHRATCVTAESWCGRAAGIDGPTWVMATYKIADCTRYIPYPIKGVGLGSWERVCGAGGVSCSQHSIEAVVGTRACSAQQSVVVAVVLHLRSTA
jgi:hypothetical protein